MASVAVEQNAEELQRLIDEALRRLDADSARLGRALRAIPAGAPVPLSVFSAISATRRNTLAAFGKILTLDTPHPARGLALTWLSLLAAGLGAFYEALRRSGSAAGRRNSKLSDTRLARSKAAFIDLDRALGCPYGCKGRG